MHVIAGKLPYFKMGLHSIGPRSHFRLSGELSRDKPNPGLIVEADLSMNIYGMLLFMFTEKHDKEKAEKERQKQLEKENAERLAREVTHLVL